MDKGADRWGGGGGDTLTLRNLNQEGQLTVFFSNSQTPAMEFMGYHLFAFKINSRRELIRVGRYINMRENAHFHCVRASANQSSRLFFTPPFFLVLPFFWLVALLSAPVFVFVLFSLLLLLLFSFSSRLFLLLSFFSSL